MEIKVGKKYYVRVPETSYRNPRTEELRILQKSSSHVIVKYYGNILELPIENVICSIMPGIFSRTMRKIFG